MEATYIGINMWKQAVEKAKSTDVDKVIAAMAGQTFKAPSGIVSKMDEKNHHLHKSVFIGEVKADGQFNVVWKTPGPVKAKPWSPVHRRQRQEARRAGEEVDAPEAAPCGRLRATAGWRGRLRRGHARRCPRMQAKALAGGQRAAHPTGSFMLIRSLFLLAALLSGHAHALTADEARAIATGETDARIEALNKAVAEADDKTAAFIQALADDAVKVAGDKVLVVKDGKALRSRDAAPSCRCRPTPRT